MTFPATQPEAHEHEPSCFRCLRQIQQPDNGTSLQHSRTRLLQVQRNNEHPLWKKVCPGM